MRRARPALGVAFVLLVSMAALTNLTGSQVEAQDDPESAAGPAESTAQISLVAQDAWVGPDGRFDLSLRLDNAPPDARLAVQVYPSVRSRTAFAETIRSESLGSPLRPLPPVLPIAFLPRNPDGSIELSFPVTTTTPPPLGVRVTGQGVFPVLISLLDAADNNLDELVTHLVRLPAADPSARPLAFALVVPFESPPGFQPDLQAVLSAGAQIRLEAAARSLARTPNVPLSVNPLPETVDAMSNTGDTGASAVASLAASLTGRQVLGGSYARLDLGAWVASPDPTAIDELDRQTTTGNQVLTGLLGVRPDRSTAVVDHTVTADALTRLYETGVDQLVIPEDQLDPLTGQAAQVTFTQRFDVVAGDGRPMQAVMADTGLADRLTATDDPVLNAHLVLADAAVLFFDRPNVARGAALVVPPDLAVPEATYDALFGGLARSTPDTDAQPVLAAMTLDDMFDSVQASTTSARGAPTLVRGYNSDPPGSLGSLLDDVAATRAHIASFAHMVGTGPGATRVPILDRQVLIAEAAALTDDARGAYLAGVSATIDAQLDAIVPPSAQTVTLTDRTADIPLTIDNQLDYPVDIRIVLTSAKLEFPDGNVRTVTLPPATPTQVDVRVESKASGAFPLDVTVQSSDGRVSLGSARFTVRSTAISGVGLLLSIGAGAFLLLWWARHWRSVRRDRRLVSSAHPSKGLRLKA